MLYLKYALDNIYCNFHFFFFKLPVKIDIIKHPREIEGKSTAVHAAVLAPEDVKIYIYPDFPEMVKNEEV